MFEQLLNTIDEESVGTLYKLEFVRREQAPSLTSESGQAPVREENPQIQKRLAQATYSQPEEPTGMSETGGDDRDSADSKTLTVSNSVPKVGRNDPCPCGAINPKTGKVYKYKKCGMINAPYHKA